MECVIAEGNSQSIVATTVRSLGTVIQYVDSGGPTDDILEKYIPAKKADELGFGWFFCSLKCAEWESEIFEVGTRQEVLATIRALEPSGDCAGVLQNLYQEDPNYNLRMGDLVAMLMDMIHIDHTALCQVPAPSENMLGFTQTIQGRSAFRRHLHEYSNSHDIGQQAMSVLQACEKLSMNFKEWDLEEEHIHRSGAEQNIIRFRDDLHAKHRETREWIKDQRNHSDLERWILSVHIRLGIFRENGETTIAASRSPHFDSEIESYFETWPDMMNALKSHPAIQNLWPHNTQAKGSTSEDLEKLCFDIWITMLFRACCWGACHYFVPGERVPLKWVGSQMPIYIG